MNTLSNQKMKHNLRLAVWLGAVLVALLMLSSSFGSNSVSGASLNQATDTNIDLITNISSDNVVVPFGGPITYTVTVENRGPATATNVDWLVEIPSAPLSLGTLVFPATAHPAQLVSRHR